jgi:hypothetical protein
MLTSWARGTLNSISQETRASSDGQSSHASSAQDQFLCYTCCNLKCEDLSMRKSLLLIAIAFAGFAGFLMGQVTAENKLEIVKYPLPGSEDTVGEVETQGRYSMTFINRKYFR